MTVCGASLVEQSGTSDQSNDKGRGRADRQGDAELHGAVTQPRDLRTCANFSELGVSVLRERFNAKIAVRSSLLATRTALVSR